MHVHILCTTEQSAQYVFFEYSSCTVLDILILSSTFTQDGWTPLMSASFEGQVDIVRMLIGAKVQVDKQKEVRMVLRIYTNHKIHHHKMISMQV